MRILPRNFRLDLSPATRFALLSLLYATELTASLWLSYELRFDFSVDPGYQHERLFVLLWLIPLQLILLGFFHQLRTLLEYFSTPDLGRMFRALAISSAVAGMVWIWPGPGFAPPRGVIVLDFVLGLMGLTGVRLALRMLRESRIVPTNGNGLRKRRVGIIGAGDAGALLAHELSLKPGYGLEPVAFFDDNRRKWHSRVHGIPVLGPPEELLEVNGEFGIEEVIIAMPSAAPRRVGELLRILRQAHLPCRTVPSLDQLASGQVKVSQLRNVEFQDLLGREKVELETENIRLALQERVVLVTGAGGSIGSELCRQIVSYRPSVVLLVERSEPQAFQTEQELIGSGHGQRIVPLVGDIMDLARMRQIFSTFRPQVVFHAAAHKHVPMMESQPDEAVRNNSLGTAQLADLAVEFGVDRFIFISTDKAINPTSVMGATKRLAEMYIHSLSASLSHQTKFMAVRFGNVLGSSGSVIGVFQRQIAEGGPVKVTHPEMMRYFMTIPEACMLVLQSAAQGTGGEIFVLDMGEPVKIVDMARQMIELSGLKPDEDIRIEFSGVRPGEKLFEELTHKGENFAPTTHAKICRFVSQPPDLGQLRITLDRLRASLCQLQPDQVKLALQQAIPEYTPYLRPRENLAATPPSLNNTRTVQPPVGGLRSREIPRADISDSFQELTERLVDQPKTWLVTGAAGFIGSNLVETLLRLNQLVIGLDNFSAGSHHNLAQIRDLVGPERWKNFLQMDGDIRVADMCDYASQGVDYILHQAALGSVPRSMANPRDFHTSNVTGLMNLLLAARQNGVKRLVYASSSSVYGDDPGLPKREHQIGRCLSPYALTKRANELYAEVFSRCYGLDSVGLRYFNVFGPRQDPDGPYAAVIPKWIAAMIRNEPIHMNGDGETSRDFCYVANVVQANLLAATVENIMAVNEIYNVAVCSRTTLNQLYGFLREELLPWYPHLRDCRPVYQDFRPGDVRHSEADISKAVRLLGYKPSHTFEQGLSEALDWYREHLGPPIYQADTAKGVTSLA